MQTPQETMKARCCYFQLKFQLRKITTFLHFQEEVFGPRIHG